MNRAQARRIFRAADRSLPCSRLRHPVLVAATLAIVLNGCASSVSGAEPEPASSAAAPSATALPSEAISGLGPTGFRGADFPIPPGARSVTVEFECTGGDPFSVELGDSMMLGQAALTGVCDGTIQLAWPVTIRTGWTLSVMIPDGVEWVASPRFSTEEWSFNANITGECEAFSEVYSGFVNADSGYTHHSAFDAAEWATRVDKASVELNALAEASQTELADSFTQMHTAVTDPQRAVGTVLIGAEDPLGQIQQICNANHTPIYVLAEFGG